jgi:hypothetical protein
VSSRETALRLAALRRLDRAAWVAELQAARDATQTDREAAARLGVSHRTWMRYLAAAPEVRRSAATGRRPDGRLDES